MSSWNRPSSSNGSSRYPEPRYHPMSYSASDSHSRSRSRSPPRDPRSHHSSSSRLDGRSTTNSSRREESTNRGSDREPAGTIRSETTGNTDHRQSLLTDPRVHRTASLPPETPAPTLPLTPAPGQPSSTVAYRPLAKVNSTSVDIVVWNAVSVRHDRDLDRFFGGIGLVWEKPKQRPVGYCYDLHGSPNVFAEFLAAYITLRSIDTHKNVRIKTTSQEVINAIVEGRNSNFTPNTMYVRTLLRRLVDARPGRVYWEKVLRGQSKLIQECSRSAETTRRALENGRPEAVELAMKVASQYLAMDMQPTVLATNITAAAPKPTPPPIPRNPRSLDTNTTAAATKPTPPPIPRIPRSFDTSSPVLQRAEHFLGSLRIQDAKRADSRTKCSASMSYEAAINQAPEERGTSKHAGIKRDISDLSRKGAYASEPVPVCSSSSRDQHLQQDNHALKRARLEREEEETAHEISEVFYDAPEASAEDIASSSPTQIGQLLSWIGNLFSGNRL